MLPHIDMAASRARANEVLTNMVEAGYLTEGQVYGARMNPAKIVERGDYYSPDWFLDWAFEEVQRIMVNRKEHILAARTTVDIGLQKTAEQSVQQTIAQYGTRPLLRPGRHGRSWSLTVRCARSSAARTMARASSIARPTPSPARLLLQALTSISPRSRTATSQPRWSATVMALPAAAGRRRTTPAACGGRMMLKDALAKSINTIAVKVSLDVGREKVIANMNKLGITRLKKTCSMALGDQGMTPLEHTGNYAVFASGGLETHPYGIEEIHTLQGELLYSHETRRAGAQADLRPQGGRDAEHHAPGRGDRTEPAKPTQLDFTYNVGKTGTSSAYRDAWFIGFTGQYVAGVWLGNDDFTPMARVTGGSFPAQTWHNFMVLAHDTDNIPQIPGIPLHPVQVAEQERLAQAANRGGDRHRGHRASHAGKRQGHVEHDAPSPREARHHAQRGARRFSRATRAAEPGRGSGG